MACCSKRLIRPLVVFAAACFMVFFIWIVVIADEAKGTPWWSFIIADIPYGDKVGHLCLIGSMSFLCNLAIPSRKPGFLRRTLTLTTFVLLVLVTLEELSQGFIASRTLDFFDWLADLVGLGCGQWLALKCGKFVVQPLRASSSRGKDALNG